MAALQRSIPSTSEDFFPVRRRASEGRPGGIAVRYLICADPVCRREEELTDNNSVGLPTQIIRKKFQQKGWEIGKNREHDTCPTCVENRRQVRRSKHKEEPVAMTKISDALNGGPPARMMIGSGPIPTEEPKKMDREERRVIFAAIEERWAPGGDSGYITPWTDHSIATHLGVPQAWVAEVRSQFFGEVKDNQEIRDLLDRAAVVLGQARVELDRATQLQKDTSSMIVRVNAMNQTLTDLRKSVEGLAAIASRIEGRVK